MVRRIVDILLSLVAGILLLPLCLLIVVAIKIDDGGAIFYKSVRAGMNDTFFNMLKFRTFNTLTNRLSHAQKAELQYSFKLENDPRITRTGYWLRQFSLDEIPQLINVLKGEMTLIGPRPKLPEEVHLYGEYKDELLSVLPGMTGYWQVHRKSASSDETMRNMDLYYIRNRNFLMDLKIFLLTMPVIFDKRNY